MSHYLGLNTPFPKGGVWGGILPTQLLPGGSRGGDNNFWNPPGGGFKGKTPLKKNFGKQCLVKYCNLLVNLDYSL
jgi:hypothetical protein